MKYNECTKVLLKNKGVVMMRIAFISDIHGNAVALEAVLLAIELKSIDKIYVLGDIAYRGPEPKKSIQMIQALQTEVIKGNADEWIVRGIQQGEVPDGALQMMNEERNWIVSRLDEEDIRYLDELKTELTLEVEGTKIHAFHATPESLFDIVLPSATDEVVQHTFMQENNVDLYIYAHIHKPYIKYINGKIVMNIGSVGLPFDGVRKASYGIIEIDKGKVSTSIERVPYDYEKVMRQYDELQYPNSKMIDVIRNAEV